MKWIPLDKKELMRWEPLETHRGYCWIRYTRDDEIFEVVGRVTWAGKGGICGLIFETARENVTQEVTHYCPIQRPEDP